MGESVGGSPIGARMRVKMGLRSHLHMRFPNVLILAESGGSGEMLGPLGPNGFHLTPTCSE